MTSQPTVQAPVSPFDLQTLAQRAIALAMPSIESAMQESWVGESGFLYIVVMNPLLTPDKAAFEDAILCEHAVGDRTKWDADYGAFARAKARVSWHAGVDSHLVQTLQPWRLHKGDTTLWGSIVLDGLVVSVSGANAPYDEAFAGSVAMYLRALIKDERQKHQLLFLA